MAKITLETKNTIVNAVGKMAYTGNIIPEVWYSTIVASNGRVSLLAILILAEIVYWYKPKEIRDEKTGDVTWEKKFADEKYLQKSYAKICEKFNVSVKQAREALIVLEKLGVVKRHFKTIEDERGKFPNIMYLELIPEVLYTLTFPTNENTDDVDKKENTSLPAFESKTNDATSNEEENASAASISKKDVLTKKETRPSSGETHPSEKDETNTKITTKITTKKTTTAHARVVVDQAMDIFAPLSLDKKDIRSIVIASGYDLAKCIQAKAMFDLQRKAIPNATGWLIDAVKKGYKLSPRIPSVKNPFNDFSQQIYTQDMMDEYEKELLGEN